MITSPGCYDLPEEEYHRDPCPTPSLSAGMIDQMLIAPKKCWYASSRLNPNWEAPDDDAKFSIGIVTHIIHLEPELFDKKVLVVDAADWRTKDADGRTCRCENKRHDSSAETPNGCDQ